MIPTQALRGLATGIGSLPHQSSAAAVELIFKYLPHIPFWPQLPRRDIREGMLTQFSERLPCLKLIDKGLVFSPGDKDKELEDFYTHIIAEDLDYFKISADCAAGWYAFIQKLQQSDLKDVAALKGHITGPFTFAASINDEAGVSLLHNSVMMQAIIKGLSMKAAWQIKALQQFHKKIIIFIDEPYLGCFGSAFTPVNRDDVIKGLGELTESIKGYDALVGVHCCGNTDWSMFTDIKTIDIISFDAYGFIEKFVLYADNLKAFLARGGIICWGIVPTQEFSEKVTVDALMGKIKESLRTLAKKGVDEALLENSLLLSPSCGLGTLDESLATKILKVLSETIKEFPQK